MSTYPYLDIKMPVSSWKRVTAFSYFSVLLDPELTDAMQDSVEWLQETAYADMWATFMNPEGQLEDSLGYEVESPYQAWMGSDHPASRRRNWGFSGMTDSLGRYYPNDPGIQWAERAIVENEDRIRRRFSQAILQTAYKLELGYP